MTPEAARRHYLEAMGITAWASRYQLPNALPTQACEWEDAPAKAPPRERLHALLDDAPPPRPRPAAAEASAPAPASSHAAPQAVRALLGGQPVETPAPQASDNAVPEPPKAVAKPLEFSLSCVCLDGRWLSLCEGDMPPPEQQLLANMLRAAGLLKGELPTVVTFKWPPMATAFTPEDPLEEAQEGLAAFVSGAASRQGWALENVLWWGASDAVEASAMAQVMALTDGRSRSLSLPVWEAPGLSTLMQQAGAKRALWPRLVALGQQWSRHDHSA